ncbi:MAG: ABC transporter substrate-binding protein [Spirochaetes bacterium]|nr:ABC transporter substrate-binding protein [Spirochaetota bacterium]
MKKIFFAVLATCFAISSVFAGGRRDANVVPIGAIFPLSGPVAFFGTESRDGALLALEQINAAGGLLGRQLAFIAEDDQNIPEETILAFQRLFTRDNARLIIGSSTSGATMAVSTLAQASQAVLISPSATNVNVTNAGDFIFRACFIDSFQGIVGAEFAFYNLGSRRAAVLYDAGADYNTDLALAFRQHFESLGGEVVSFEAYMTGDVDFNAQITRMAATSPDLVFLPNFFNDVALQVMQLRGQGVDVPLLGGDGWGGLTDLIGTEAENTFWTGAFAADTTAPKGVAFVNDFQARFGRVPSQFAALGFVAMQLVAEGILAAGSFDAPAVRDAMARIDGEFVTGNIRFDANRNPIKGAAVLQIVSRDGVMVNAYYTTINPR